jgi:hypothetical protein
LIEPRAHGQFLHAKERPSRVFDRAEVRGFAGSCRGDVLRILRGHADLLRLLTGTI